MVLCSLAVGRNRALDQAHVGSPKSRCKSAGWLGTACRAMFFTQVRLSRVRTPQSVVELQGDEASESLILFPATSSRA